MLDRRTLLTGIAASGATLAGGWETSAAAAGGEIALTERRGRFLVDVRLNGGQAYRFVLDTGSSTHFISSAIATTLRLPQVEFRNIRSFGGAKVEPIVSVQRFDVGGVLLTGARAVSWNPAAMEGHDGLVGYPILGGRACLDLGARRLSLNAPRPPADAVQVDAIVSGAETVLRGGVDGAAGRFVFDTGSARCVVSRDYVRRLRETEAFARADQIVTVNERGVRSGLTGLQLPELRFGDLVLDRPFVEIADPAASPEIFRNADALLGAELIGRCAWTIDRAARTLHAAPSGAA